MQREETTEDKPEYKSEASGKEEERLTETNSKPASQDDVSFAHDERQDTPRVAVNLYSEDELYGRKKEKDELLNAYRCLKTSPARQANLVLMTGPAGVGKTSLALSLRDDVEADGGFFVRAKFDQLEQLDPYQAIRVAFSDFATAALARGDETVQQLQKAIRGSIASEARVLLDMIPALKPLVGEQREATSVHGQEAISRFLFVFRLFLTSICTAERPLVVLLDDLQWIDQSSLDLLASLIPDKTMEGILFLGTCRDGIDRDSPLSKMLRRLEEENVKVSNVRVKNLDKQDVSLMVSDLIPLPQAERVSLLEFVMARTKGHALFIVELLCSLQKQGRLVYQETVQKWIWSIEEAAGDVSGFETLRDLVHNKLIETPQPVQEVLKVAAFIGANIDERILDVSLSAPVQSYLRIAQEQCLLQHDPRRGVYVFVSNGVQEEVYSIVPEAERAPTHLAIGRKLMRSLKEDELDAHIFTVLGQLRRGVSLLTNQRENYSIAALCLVAGECSVRASCFPVAAIYLQFGISLLGPKHWEEEYDLSIALYSSGAEVAYCNSDFDLLDRLVEEVFVNGKTFSDKVRVHAIRIYRLGATNKANEAIEAGLNVLEQLGEPFPSRCTMAHIVFDLLRVKQKLRGRSNESFVRIPPIRNPEKIAAMQILNVIFLNAYQSENSLSALLAIRMVRITLDYGLSAISAVGFSVYGMLVCSSGDLKEGVRYANLALVLLDKYQSLEFLPRVYAAVFGFVYGWKRYTGFNREPLKHAFQVGLESGDIEFAMVDAVLYAFTLFNSGETLPNIDKEVTTCLGLMETRKQSSALVMMRPFLQMVRNFRDLNDDPTTLSGDIVNAIEHRRALEESNNQNMILWTHYQSMLLKYMFGHFEDAVADGEKGRPMTKMPFAGVDITRFALYDGLSCLALYQAGKQSRKRKYLRNARRSAKLLKGWAKTSPANCLGKLKLVLAELAVATGNHYQAIEKFSCAIALFRDEPMEFGLSNELAGRYYRKLGETEEADSFLREAFAAYERWGGTAKTRHMAEEFPFLLETKDQRGLDRLTSTSSTQNGN